MSSYSGRRFNKLFNGPECIAGLNLQVGLKRGLRNDELAQFHRFLDTAGLKNNWSGEVLEQFPFTIKDEFIGSMSGRPDFGDGALELRPSPLVHAGAIQRASADLPSRRKLHVQAMEHAAFVDADFAGR